MEPETGLTTADHLDENAYTIIQETVSEAQRRITYAVNTAMVEAYWEIGKQITENIGVRSRRNSGALKELSNRLTAEFGKGFEVTNLRRMRRFYLAFPKRETLSPVIGWSHYCQLIQIEHEDERSYYLQQAVQGHWSVRELQRQIQTHAYWRLIATQKRKLTTELPSSSNTSQQSMTIHPADNIFKDPYVLDFLNLDQSPLFLESNLEQALIDSLRDFLLELGNGFSFVARQKRISDGTDHYYIDLVFYNSILKCSVLIDLKTGKLTPQDVGQMDFYVRLFDDQYRARDDNPTIGIILCANKSKSMAKYSALANNPQLYAAQYATVLPTEEELAQVLERNERELLEARAAVANDLATDKN